MSHFTGNLGGASDYVETTMKQDLDAYDALPSEIRAALREASFTISAASVARVRVLYGDRAALRAVHETDERLKRENPTAHKAEARRRQTAGGQG